MRWGVLTMNDELQTRQDSLLSFIDATNRETQKVNDINNLREDPELKLRKLDKEAKDATPVCIDTILGRIYKNALPFDDPKKNCSDADAAADVRDYISNRCDGKNSEWYVKEGIKRSGSSVLKGILTEAQNMSKRFYREKAKDIGRISIDDLKFNANTQGNELDKITRKLELDEISDIIQNNVQRTLQDEKDRVNREDEFNKKIEDSLMNDDSVTDDSTLESAMDKQRKAIMPRIYQPSLFEAIMLNKTRAVTESSSVNPVYEAIEEFTLLNMSKALMLEKFDLRSIKSLANNYIK